MAIRPLIQEVASPTAPAVPLIAEAVTLVAEEEAEISSVSSGR